MQAQLQNTEVFQSKCEHLMHGTLMFPVQALVLNCSACSLLKVVRQLKLANQGLHLDSGLGTRRQSDDARARRGRPRWWRAMW